QEQTVYAGPSNQQLASRNRVGRWIYLLLPALVVVLVGGSMFWLQWASQRGITLGYPMPAVHIISTPSNPLLIDSSATFSANATGRDITYTWDFGDGTTAIGSTVDHTYQSDGSFTVTV